MLQHHANQEKIFRKNNDKKVQKPKIPMIKLVRPANHRDRLEVFYNHYPKIRRL